MRKAGHIVVCIVICLALLTPTGCGKENATTKTKTDTQANQEEQSAGKELRLLVNRGKKSVVEIAQSLEYKPQRSYEDFIDLGTCYLWQGDYVRAAESFEIAAQIAPTTVKLSGALYNKAAALGYVNIRLAIQAADLAAKVQPDNIEISRLRFALHKQCSDQLGFLVSADQLSKLDPAATGHEVLEPLTAGLILGGIAIVSASLTTVSIYAMTPPEDRAKVVQPIMDGYFSVVSTTVKTLGTPFGRMLLEGDK